MGIPYIYDGLHAGMTDNEIQEKLNKGESYTIRFKVPHKTIIVNDVIQGKVKFETKLIGDFIIVKSDGFPSYNYAVVIDDYLMKISHVIRGVGHLSNTPRQIMIAEALDFPIPVFAHVSEIVGNTHTPYGSILDLRNHMLAIMDTLADSIEDVKMASHQIENYQASSSEDDEYNEDEENGELNGF
jgi:glutamyl-tRNA synthetase/nondiscriminating glutamyl-tRNA synthetase